MDHRLHAPSLIPTKLSWIFFSIEIDETYSLMNIFWAEMPRNLEIWSKSSVEAIKNTTLCKRHEVPKGFRPMRSNA